MAILLLSPLLIQVAIILRLSGEGEILFLQKRVGKYAKPFKLYKFATMLKDSPNIGSGTVTLKDDSRVLPFGKFLRKTKINELPQLINVFRGDMSVVGPRPQTQRCFDVFPEELKSTISDVRPGLSGLGSIIFRDEENMLLGTGTATDFYDEVIAPYKGAIEAYYVSNRTIYMYFKVILITICVVFFPKSKNIWSIFSDLPVPPESLKNLLNYSES